VDDDPAVRDSLAASLQGKGYSVQAYGSAECFLEQYDPEQAGCIVLDVSMPGMDGVQLQEELTQRGCTRPIIFITGHGDVPLAVKAIKAGAKDFLEKPFRQAALLELIDQAFAEDLENRAAKSESDAVKVCFNRLTPREKDVMRLLVTGPANLSSKEIARELDISYRTVHHHRARVMEKMQAESLPDLVAKAQICGLKT
jgi:RNA polymerase sigma factor (sigma-70 family)